MDTLNIRVMTPAEIEMMINWAAQEGWNPGLNDGICYHRADPNGFLVGLLGDEPVGTISVVRYSDNFGFLGFYMVKPEYRGRGYGMQLWQAGLDYLDGCSVGLDGVVAQQDNYRRSGFELAWRNVRYEGRGLGSRSDDKAIKALDLVGFDELCAYDRPFFHAERRDFLAGWIEQPGARALGILPAGKLAGYGVIRPCREGFKVGPLYADSAELAERLFTALIGPVDPGEKVYLDVPERNPEAVALAKRQGMTLSFETARMYKGEVSSLPLERLFGVTSFEIG